jgi:Dolichyl-phosphate-mannose-protein mannosyltransferase
VCALFFVLIGFAFSPQAGIQNDEALFASAIHQRPGSLDAFDGFKVGRHRIPTMLMSYLGALKSWIYVPIFRFWRPSPASLRIPMILAGGATIWVFWSLLRRIAGYRAAAAGCVLLATDTLFLMTTCFDWGPVVLQHLLMVSGVLFLVRFHQEGRQRRFLAAGFFLLGLGLWDKALFGWILSGMAVAAVATFPKELWKYLTVHNLAISILAFLVGCAPLVRYNLRHPLETFRANAGYSAGDIPGRIFLLRMTLAGRALFGYIPRDDAAGHPRAAQTALERGSVWLSDKTGGQESSLFPWAMAAALLLTPWLWFTPARRPLAFSLIAMLIAFAQMLFAKGAGGSVHHIILLWPLPAFFVAIATAEASRRIGPAGKPLLATILALVAGSSLLVTNEYFARLARNGPAVVWTDAIYPLSDYLSRVKARAIYMDDWGMLDTLHMLSRGRLPLRVGSDPLSKPQLGPEDKGVVFARMAEVGAIFVGHTDGDELFPGVNAKLRSLAGEAGYRREMLAEIPDRNGRTMFEVFRFERAH